MKKKQRSSGILLAVSSLPSEYGIGSLGAPARRFVDFLHEAKQRYWQILPLVPTGEGNSPYMSPSAFAGSPYYIDLDELAGEGLLAPQELEAARYHSHDRVDFQWLHDTRIPLLKLAFARSQKLNQRRNSQIFLPWLGEYAHFAALADKYGYPYEKWPKDAKPDKETVEFHVFLQTIFYRQWKNLKDYANEKGVLIMGDIPIYLSPQSAERWAKPKLFIQDKEGKLTKVAGVPPDAFTEEGQFWGNPLYDWENSKEALYDFWAERMEWCGEIYDCVRIDHFRAIHTYWEIPADAKSAKEGHWVEGPGMDFLEHLQHSAPKLELVAEDLGDLDDDALDFVRNCGIDGMNVMVFAFDTNHESAYLPHNCRVDSVIYSGTHDTPTFVQWFEESDEQSVQFATRYLRLRYDEGFSWGVIAGAWSSPSRLAIAPLQDVLGLSGDTRMNTPGTMGDHNWSWRVRAEAFNPFVSGKLKEFTQTYCRDTGFQK